MAFEGRPLRSDRLQSVDQIRPAVARSLARAQTHAPAGSFEFQGRGGAQRRTSLTPKAFVRARRLAGA